MVESVSVIAPTRRASSGPWDLRASGRGRLSLRESEHQPRLIGDPMRVQFGHLIEQLLVGCSGFLQPIEVLQITLGVLDRRGRVGRARLLVTGDNDRWIQRR